MHIHMGDRKYRLLVIDCPPHKVDAVKRKLALFDTVGAVIHDQFRIKFSVDVTEVPDDEVDSKLREIQEAVKMVLGYSAVRRLD